jgi:hypothetical protein
LPGNLAIGGTGATAQRDIEVNSAGDFAYMTVGDGNQAEDASTHRRGYNLAVLDAASGRLLRKAAFDTAANEYEAAEMARFLEQVPAGQVVVAAMQGDGARHLTDAAVAALHSIGSGVDPRQDMARSHALVGVKGAPAGSAAEVWEKGPAYLRLGRNADTRTLAAALSRLSLE